MVDPLIKRIATLQPVIVTTDETPFQTQTTKTPFVKHVFVGSARLSQPWTHREQKPETVECPNGDVSPIEMAIVWVGTCDVFN